MDQYDYRVEALRLVKDLVLSGDVPARADAIRAMAADLVDFLTPASRLMDFKIRPIVQPDGSLRYEGKPWLGPIAPSDWNAAIDARAQGITHKEAWEASARRAPAGCDA